MVGILNTFVSAATGHRVQLNTSARSKSHCWVILCTNFMLVCLKKTQIFPHQLKIFHCVIYDSVTTELLFFDFFNQTLAAK